MKYENDIPIAEPKDIPFITHDLGARNDPKLMDLQMEMGGKGLGIFWCLVEMLWENGGYIPANYKSIAFSLRWCKPAEVEKVVTGFGLFQIEDGTITSASALRRIKVRREKIAALSQARREAGIASGRARQRDSSQQNGNKTGTNDEQNANKCSANGEQTRTLSIYPSINLSIDNNINNIAPPTAADFYEIFFFRNLKDPAGEVERFLEHYHDSDWKHKDGTSVEDPFKAAEGWNPKISKKRFKDEALRWYKAIWNDAAKRIDNAHSIFLESLDDLRLSGQTLTLVFKTAEAGLTVGRFIMDNDLAGDFQLDFRVSN